MIEPGSRATIVLSPEYLFPLLDLMLCVGGSGERAEFSRFKPGADEQGGVRRKEKRFTSELELVCKSLHGKFKTTTLNISEGGALIKISEKIPIGTMINVKIKHPKVFFPINVQAQVARIQNEPYSAGIRFIFKDKSTRKRVAKLIATLKDHIIMEISY